MQGVQCIGRSAYFAQRSQDPRSLQGWQSSHDCFAEAARLSDPPFEAVEVPYEGATLPGYFFRVDDSGERRPTVITMTGMDGYVEECYWGVAAALERGYNCLAFDGPGQGGVLRQREVPFRPDWEAVGRPSGSTTPSGARRTTCCSPRRRAPMATVRAVRRSSSTASRSIGLMRRWRRRHRSRPSCPPAHANSSLIHHPRYTVWATHLGQRRPIV
jgi:hypothetical protein